MHRVVPSSGITPQIDPDFDELRIDLQEIARRGVIELHPDAWGVHDYENVKSGDMPEATLNSKGEPIGQRWRPKRQFVPAPIWTAGQIKNYERMKVIAERGDLHTRPLHELYYIRKHKLAPLDKIEEALQKARNKVNDPYTHEYLNRWATEWSAQADTQWDTRARQPRQQIKRAELDEQRRRNEACVVSWTNGKTIVMMPSGQDPNIEGGVKWHKVVQDTFWRSK